MIIVKNLLFNLERRITPLQTEPMLGTYASDDAREGRLRPIISFEYNNNNYLFEIMNPAYSTTQIKDAIRRYVASGALLTTDIRVLAPRTAESNTAQF